MKLQHDTMISPKANILNICLNSVKTQWMQDSCGSYVEPVQGNFVCVLTVFFKQQANVNVQMNSPPRLTT